MRAQCVAALALLLLVGSACAQRVTNACEDRCKDDVKPLCVEHYDTGCKPSWWGEPDIQGGRCMSLAGVDRVRRVMPNECKYKCIAAQFCWEKWEVVKERVRMSDYCKKQWKKFGFAAAAECQKC